MAEFPFMPLSTDAYLADTRHLSQAEHGAYLLLLMTAWRTPDCALPDDDKVLARYAGCDLRTWKRQRETVLLGFFTLNDQQKWVQRRLLKERDHAEDVRNKRRDAANSKHMKTNETYSANAGAKAEQKTSNSDAPIPIPTKKDSESKDSGENSPSDPDLKKVIYDRAKSMMGAKSGGLVTGSLKSIGLAQTVEVVEAMRKERPVEPIPWFRKAVEARAKPPPSPRPKNPKSNAADDPYGDQAGFEAALAAAEATR